MQSDPHERAHFLIDEALAAGIAPGDERWLHSHVEACAGCAAYAELTSRIVRSLNALSFESDPAMTIRVRDSLAQQARSRYRGATAWRWGLATAAALALATAPLYKSVTDKRREVEIEKADTLLLERVNARLSQTLPEAMEPPAQQPLPGGKNK